MTIQQVVFILISALTLVSAVIVVTDRNLFRAAVALMASFLGVAGLYILLEAGFLAAAQLLVYIGAISILMIFAIMMTRRLMQTSESPFNSQPKWLSFIVALFVVALMAVVIWNTWPNSEFGAPAAASPAVLRGSSVTIGKALVSPDAYVLPFEVVSVLLLAALVGAVVIASPEKNQ
jgi:NADH:ubiquinone oxidoreductase subunit 6 (subunit J)